MDKETTPVANGSAKKRLMFVTHDDFYFLTYNLILVLSALECTSKDKVFTDLKKIAYLIDLILRLVLNSGHSVLPTSGVNFYLSNPFQTPLEFSCSS